MQKYWKGAVEGMTEDPEGQVGGWEESLSVILTASRRTASSPAVAPSSLVSEDGWLMLFSTWQAPSLPPGKPLLAACTSAATASWESCSASGLLFWYPPNYTILYLLSN